MALQAEHRKTSQFVMIGLMIETAAIRSDVRGFKIGPTSDATYLFKVNK
jgi:peptide/nickel transport system substrate-binding protein